MKFKDSLYAPMRHVQICYMTHLSEKWKNFNYNNNFNNKGIVRVIMQTDIALKCVKTTVIHCNSIACDL